RASSLVLCGNSVLLHNEPTYTKICFASGVLAVMGSPNVTNITQLRKLNRVPRKQKGQRIKPPSAFFLRYYVSTTDEDGAPVRRQECIKIADKNDLYRSWADVEQLIQGELERVNSGAEIATGKISIADFVEKHYLPWCESNKSAATKNGYERGVWECYWKPCI